MPKYTVKAAPVPEILVTRLASVIRGGESAGTADEPTLFEQEISPGESYHVLVVWPAWHEVKPETRYAVIMAAYERADPDKAKAISVAVGVTIDEALSMGLLPHEVITVRRENDPVTKEDLEKAMLAEGAFRTPNGVRMCQPNRDAAEDAYRRLTEKVGPYWAITETPSFDRD